MHDFAFIETLVNISSKVACGIKEILSSGLDDHWGPLQLQD